VKDLMMNNVIKPSYSLYNSPVWVIPKKSDSQGNKKWRMAIDFRALNNGQKSNEQKNNRRCVCYRDIGSVRKRKIFSTLYSISRQSFTKYRYIIWCIKNSLFHSRALSFRSNAIWIKECARHVSKTDGSDIIRIIRECLFILMTSSFTCFIWRTRQNSINLPNDYDES